MARFKTGDNLWFSVGMYTGRIWEVREVCERVYGICPSGSFFVEYVPIEDVDTLAEPWHNDG